MCTSAVVLLSQLQVILSQVGSLFFFVDVTGDRFTLLGVVRSSEGCETHLHQGFISVS